MLRNGIVGKDQKFTEGQLVRVNDFESPFHEWECRVESIEGRSITGLLVKDRVHEWYYRVKADLVPRQGPVFSIKLYFPECKLKDSE